MDAATVAQIYPEEDEQQEGKSPERTATIAEERQWNADDGGQADNHADIDEYMEYISDFKAHTENETLAQWELKNWKRRNDR